MSSPRNPCSTCSPLSFWDLWCHLPVLLWTFPKPKPSASGRHHPMSNKCSCSSVLPTSIAVSSSISQKPPHPHTAHTEGHQVPLGSRTSGSLRETQSSLFPSTGSRPLRSSQSHRS